MKKEFLDTTKQLHNFVKKVINLDMFGSTVGVLIALHGELGAGKTSFVQVLARELGVKETVTSPTFTIMQIYDIPNHAQFKKLIHIDAYRIENIEEARPLGLEELMNDPKNLICIEWAERLADILDTDTLGTTHRLDITFAHNDDGEGRTVTYVTNDKNDTHGEKDDKRSK